MVQFARFKLNNRSKLFALVYLRIESFRVGRDSEKKRLLDHIGRKIISALQSDARLSFADLGRLVGLSPPAVAERVRRMEETGIIKGYHAVVNPEDIGLPLSVFIRLDTPAERYPRVIALAESLPEVLECHHVSGGDSFIMKIAVRSTSQLEEIINRFGAFGSTVTSIILSSPVSKREVEGVFEEE